MAMDKNQYNLYYLKIFMSVLNFMILLFHSVVIIITLRSVSKSFSARNFLENVTYLPREPIQTTVILFVSFFLLLYIIEVRKRAYKNRIIPMIIYGMEIMLCLVIIRCLYGSYNGIILLVIADIVASIKGKQNRFFFMIVMSAIYIISDYSILSMIFKMPSFSEFLSIYQVKDSTFLVAIGNMWIALNIIVFIIYMVILMQNQMKENARIALLNIQLQTANEQLKEMNEQLKDYALMQEKMGETRERNRIAREIHDTLGHTMTGLSAGIDACIAMIDYSVDGTKKQLQLISKVARQGIQDIRRSVNKLRPDALEHTNLEHALKKMMEDTMKVSDVKIDYRCDVATLKFSQDEEDMVYRVVQEGITNAIRHGKASKINVDITKEEKYLILTIKDNGIGCKDIKSGFGLIHIQERIEMLDGNVVYDGSDGFTIIARIPIRWGENYD
jgi:signal transduction histidine kinase